MVLPNFFFFAPPLSVGVIYTRKGKEYNIEDMLLKERFMQKIKFLLKKIKQIKIKDIKNSAVLRVEKNQNQWFSRLR
jgi:hypothetical protein